MADGLHGGDVGWMQWAIGGLAGAGLVITGWLYAAVAGVRREDRAGRKAIWERLNQSTDAAAEGRLDDAQRYATQHDLDKLEERLGDRLGETEQRIMSAISNRGPVRPR